MSKEISRREFMKRGSLGLAAGSVMLSTSAKSYANIMGANDTIHIAVIGIRGRGGEHIKNFAQMKNVKVKYIVDIDENLYDRSLLEVDQIAGYRPKTAWDMRKVFEDKKLYGITPKEPGEKLILAALLNSTLSRCFIEFTCRQLTGAQAIADIDVAVVESLLVPDISKIQKSIRQKLVKCFNKLVKN